MNKADAIYDINRVLSDFGDTLTILRDAGKDPHWRTGFAIGTVEWATRVLEGVLRDLAEEVPA